MNRRVSTAFIDALLLLLLVMIILPHKPAPRATPTVDIFSQLIVGARWRNGSPADIDLWVRAPGDPPVGFKNTRGSVMGFVWDDVAKVDDPPWRYEAVMARRVRDGEYAVNVHAYTLPSGPEEIEVAIWRKTPAGVRELWAGKVTLTTRWEEATVVRFTMQDGEPLPGSFHFAPVTMVDTGERTR